MFIFSSSLHFFGAEIDSVGPDGDDYLGWLTKLIETGVQGLSPWPPEANT